MAYEEPPYDVVSKADGYEVREYDDRIAAQVSSQTRSNKAFRTLFKYISGANQSAEKVSMTVPVAQSEKIEVTVPVTQGAESDVRYMQFFLPSSYTLETAPKPTNPSVEVIKVEGGYYAVYGFSGRANDKNAKDAEAQLLDRLSRDGVTVTSEVIRATYNGPLTLPFNRRNEAMVRIVWP
ncbi:SOUL family heme-binding protein [Nereida sp.]|uniref:SOUL family heme-binding protein n=1 Tax=Nereida sp. TaxID=2736090 RepID=UPI003F69CB0C